MVFSRLCDGDDDGDGGDASSRRRPGRQTRGLKAQQRESSSWGESSTMIIVEILTKGT